jgi:hypothetical protein
LGPETITDVEVFGQHIPPVALYSGTAPPPVVSQQLYVALATSPLANTDRSSVLFVDFPGSVVLVSESKPPPTLVHSVMVGFAEFSVPSNGTVLPNNPASLPPAALTCGTGQYYSSTSHSCLPRPVQAPYANGDSLTGTNQLRVRACQGYLVWAKAGFSHALM